MKDTSESEKETPETSVSDEVEHDKTSEDSTSINNQSEKTSEETIEDETEKSEDAEEKPISMDSKSDETSEEIEPGESSSTDETTETEEKFEEKKVEAKDKKEKIKGEKKDKDFKYIVRISNTDINGEKNLVYGLTTIKGIGVHMATLIADTAGIDRYTKIGDLKDSEVEKIQEIINTVNRKAPSWMVNHRKDYETGEDIHLVGSDIDMKLRDEVNIMKKIRSYRGIRHERGLPVRGQRTRSNNRKGLALGVSKKRD